MSLDVRDLYREARRIERRFWWQRNGELVVTLAVALIGVAVIVTVGVWL